MSVANDRIGGLLVIGAPKSPITREHHEFLLSLKAHGRSNNVRTTGRGRARAGSMSHVTCSRNSYTLDIANITAVVATEMSSVAF